MKFSVSQSTLAKAIAVVSKGLASATNSAILAGILVRAEEGTMELQTTNQTIHVRDLMAANVSEPGETVVSGRMLANIVKALPDSAVTFETDGPQIGISCEHASFRMNTMDAADFPEFPTYALESSISLPVEVLREMEGRVGRAVSRDTSRPILTGILLTVDEGNVRLVATDTFRMAVCDTQVEGEGLERPFEMIVPAAAFHDVLGFAEGAPTVLVGSTRNQVVFECGDVTYVSRRIEGTFPNYRAIMPESSNTQIVCPVEEFDAVLRRVSVIAQSHPSVHMGVDVDGQLVTLSAKSVDAGEAMEQMDAKVTGASTMIALNYRYVFDCLAALRGEKDVTVELRSSREPALFKSIGKVSYVYLLMPLRD